VPPIKPITVAKSISEQDQVRIIRLYEFGLDPGTRIEFP